MIRTSRRLRWTLRGAALLLAMGGVALGHRWHLDPEAVPTLAPSALTLVPGVHMLGSLAPSTVYAVETSAGIVLIDSGLESDAGPVKAQMRKLGLSWKDVRAILITHVHGDHVGGAGYLRETVGAKIYAGKEDAPPIRAGTSRPAFFSVFYMPNHSPHPTPVDVELSGGEVLRFGEVTIRVLGLPGHTPGSMGYLMERGGLRILFAGDVISMLMGDVPRFPGGRKPLGTYSAGLAPRYRGDAGAYLESLRKLRAIPVPDLVLPGHPRSDPEPQSPRLSQSQWEAMLDEGIRELETLLARYRADGPDFLDGVPKVLLPDLYYLGDRQGKAVYALRAGGKLAVVNAPGGAGLPNFVAERLRLLGVSAAEISAVVLTSANSEDLGALTETIEATGGRARVVAPSEALEKVRKACPAGSVVPAEEIRAVLPIDVQVIPLGSRGGGETAYLVPWAGHAVLFSGTVPSQAEPAMTEALETDLAASREATIDYLTAIHRLAPLKPGLWLPLVPVDGQNANQYESDWKGIVNWNYQLGYSVLENRH